MKKQKQKPKILDNELIESKQKNITFILFFILAVFSSLILFTNLSGNTPFYPDEALYTVMELDTLESGEDILFPSSNQHFPTYYKPPLKTWLKHPLYKIFGFNIFTMRFLDALMGLITVLVVFLIGKRLFNQWVGFASGFIFITFQGMLIDYWARVNAFDAGLVLGITLFLYFFVSRFDKPFGWLYCGAALAFAFYFKHISALLPLCVVTVYLIITRGFSFLFDRRYLLTVLTLVLLVLVWHIPYFLQNPEILNYFFSVEIKQRITGGFKDQDGYSNSFAHIKQISTITSVWFWWIIPSVIIAVAGFYKAARKKLWLLVSWFILPLILLTIAASRLTRYMFPFYPALALILGYAITQFIMLMYRTLKQKSRLFYRLAFSTIIIVISITTIAAALGAIETTKTFRKEFSHVFTKFYQNEEQGKIYLTEEDPYKYSWIERICLASVSGKIRYKEADQTITDLVKSLNNHDSLVIYRYELVREIFFQKNVNDIFTHFKFIDLTSNPGRYNGTRKIILFENSGAVDRYFQKMGLNPHHLSEYIGLWSSENRKFIADLTELTFGFSLEPREKIDFYAKALDTGNLTRKEIVERFTCYEQWYSPRNVPRWWKHNLGEAGKGKFHRLVDFYRPDRKGNLHIVNLSQENLTKNMFCYSVRAFNRWQNYDDPGKITKLLMTITGNDAIIIRRSEMIRLISDTSKIRTLNSRQFCYLTLKRYRGEFQERKQYVNIVAIFTVDGELYRYLSRFNLPINLLRPLEKIVNWELGDDREFINNTAVLIFGSVLNEKWTKSYLEGLSQKTLSRKAIVKDMVGRAQSIQY